MESKVVDDLVRLVSNSNVWDGKRFIPGKQWLDGPKVPDGIVVDPNAKGESYLEWVVRFA